MYIYIYIYIYIYTYVFQDDDVLEALEPKGQILEFLVELYERNYIYIYIYTYI